MGGWGEVWRSGGARWGLFLIVIIWGWHLTAGSLPRPKRRPWPRSMPSYRDFCLSRHGAACQSRRTQAIYAAAKALGAVTVFFHRDTRDTLFEAGKLTVTLMFIIANALILKHVLTDEQIPQQIAGAMLAAGFGPMMFLMIVNVILLIGGSSWSRQACWSSWRPWCSRLRSNWASIPIHLGIIMVVNMEIGMITPPVGLNLFVTSGVAGMPMMRVVKAALAVPGSAFRLPDHGHLYPGISDLAADLMMGPRS